MFVVHVGIPDYIEIGLIVGNEGLWRCFSCFLWMNFETCCFDGKKSWQAIKDRQYLIGFAKCCGFLGA